MTAPQPLPLPPGLPPCRCLPARPAFALVVPRAPISPPRRFTALATLDGWHVSIAMFLTTPFPFSLCLDVSYRTVAGAAVEALNNLGILTGSYFSHYHIPDEFAYVRDVVVPNVGPNDYVFVRPVSSERSFAAMVLLVGTRRWAPLRMLCFLT